MSFALSTTVNPERVFLVRKSAFSGRWDPHYHQPRFIPLIEKLQALNAHPLRSLTQDIFSGITPLSGGEAYTSADDGVAFIRSGDFNEDGTINKNDLIYIRPDVHNGIMQRSQLAQHDILFAIVGATIGKVGIFPGGYDANINQAICAVRLSKDVSPQYVHAFFLTYLGKEQIERIKRPVARANINLDEIGSLRLPIISDKIQELVVDTLLGGFSQKLRLEKQAKELLASIDEVLLQELGIVLPPPRPNSIESRIFKRPFSEVTGRRLDPLYHHGDMFHFVRGANSDLFRLADYVTAFITGFAAGRNDQGEEEDGIIQIRPTNINEDRELVFNRNVYISPSELSNRPLDILKRCEVLFNNTNSQEQVGKSAFFDLGGEYFCSNHITHIATNNRALDPQYLCYILNLYQRQKVFFKLCTNWNNQSGVGVDVLSKIPIPLPGLKKQERIVEALEKIRDDARILRQRAKSELEQAKKEIEAIILGEGEKS